MKNLSRNDFAYTADTNPIRRGVRHLRDAVSEVMVSVVLYHEIHRALQIPVWVEIPGGIQDNVEAVKL